MLLQNQASSFLLFFIPEISVQIHHLLPCFQDTFHTLQSQKSEILEHFLQRAPRALADVATGFPPIQSMSSKTVLSALKEHSP